MRQRKHLIRNFFFTDRQYKKSTPACQYNSSGGNGSGNFFTPTGDTNFMYQRVKDTSVSMAQKMQ